MAELHAGYSVPASQLESIPMDNHNQTGPATRQPQYDVPRLEAYRSFGAQSYWDFFVRYKVAVLAIAVSTAVVITFVTLTVYLALNTDESYSKMHLERIVEEEYPVTRESALDDFEEKMGHRVPGFGIQEELSDDMLNAMYSEVYKMLPDSESRRYKRETTEEKIDICKRNNENCKVVLTSMHQIVRNVNDQVDQLQKLLNRIGIINGTTPLTLNTTMLELARCLECQKLESQDIVFIDEAAPDNTPAPNIEPSHSSNNSQIFRNLTDKINTMINKTSSKVNEGVQKFENYQAVHARKNENTNATIDEVNVPESSVELIVESGETGLKNIQNVTTGKNSMNHTISTVDVNTSSPEILHITHTNYSTVINPDGSKIMYVLKNTTIVEKPPTASNSTEGPAIIFNSTEAQPAITLNSTVMPINVTNVIEMEGNITEEVTEDYDIVDISKHLSNVNRNTSRRVTEIRGNARKSFDDLYEQDVDRPVEIEREKYNDDDEKKHYDHFGRENSDGEDAKQRVIDTKRADLAGPEPSKSNPKSLNSSAEGVEEDNTVITTEAYSHVLTTIDPEETVSRKHGPQPKIVSNPNDQPKAKGGYEPNPFLFPSAETMKSSQQVLYTPSMTWMPYPVCFQNPPNPPPPSFRQTAAGGITFSATSQGAPYPAAPQTPHVQPFLTPSGRAQLFPPNYFQTQPMMQPMSQVQPVQQAVQYPPIQQFQPSSVPVLPQRVGLTGPDLQTFQLNQVNQPLAARTPYYCTYIPAPTFQFPVIPGVSEFQRSASEASEFDNDDEERHNYRGNDQAELKSRDYTVGCPMGTHACANSNRCISRSQWCDGNVDCPDASDERRCSCRDRVEKERLCDGYFDCPRGEDELGCFGCDKHSFSCGESGSQYPGANCVPLSQRCDGYRQCSNGKDETDCNILTHSIRQNDMFTVGYTTGYHHRNWQGRWYPVCGSSESGAMEACRAEIGSDIRGAPIIQPVDLSEDYPGLYLMELPSGEVQTVSSCYNKAILVKCPTMPCGTRVLPHQERHPHYDPTFEDSFLGNAGIPSTTDNYRNYSKRSIDSGTNLLELPTPSLDHIEKSDPDLTEGDDVISQSRVVGGHPSQPKAWPSLVAIFKDGTFHCGGAILDEYWILTAAHCVENYSRHYYEIQAGMLRRFSFSPMEQSRRAKQIVIHHAYDKIVMKNDLALIRLAKPLYFNRWVRPVCLPETSTAGPFWRRGPPAATTCTTVGWGATVEHGLDPDHMREVEVPILSHCKHRTDQNEAAICAGMPQGGRDACQGDSGGPLMCRNPMSPSQWYVAGIVSHGEGCARPDEPGAYTKVSLFVDWINRIRHGHNLPATRMPLDKCPGLHCDRGLGRCIPSRRQCDKTVDCLNAEDELNCHTYHNYDFFRNFKSNASDVAEEESNPFVGNAMEEKASRSEGDSTIGNENTTDAITTQGTPTTGTTDIISVEGNSTASGLDSPSSTQTPAEESSSGTPSEAITSTTPEITEVTTTTEPVQNVTEKISERNLIVVTKKPILKPPTVQHFICKKLIQNIPFSKRCDRRVDCEDGTDEDDCTCRDYLVNAYPSAICDGHIDCNDESDEENCVVCGAHEFHCRRSGKCIPKKKRCDGHIDCQLKEDEKDCYALTNGEYIIMDLDGRPHLNVEGILTGYRNGEWLPICRKNISAIGSHLGKEFCEYLGYGNYESFNATLVQDKPLEVRESSRYRVIGYEYPPVHVVPTPSEFTCSALYLRCVPSVNTDVDSHQVQVTENGNSTFLWPWHAAIFVDGQYHCSAVLLEPNWLLTSIHCADDVKLKHNYTTALLGMSRSYLLVDGPNQEIAPVDEMKHVENTDALLLHLKYPVNLTRHIQPIYLQKRVYPASEEDACVAVGVDKDYHTRTVFLQAMVHNCPDCHRCYKNIFPEDYVNETSPAWSGTVVCLGAGGWYPAAVYYEKDGAYGFMNTQTLSSIDYINSHLITAMAEKPYLSEEPICNGFRCPLGQCVAISQVCDGVPDCRDGGDEDPRNCQQVKDNCTNSVYDSVDCKCTKSELRCGNGQCVPKAAFCDGHIDCSDGTDEPTKCSCAAYLKLTTPERICDGRRHCLDKSDEMPEHCLCKDADFKCEKQGECVSQDFVCDGQPDCSMGEDEKNCQAIRRLPGDPLGTGEVIQRSYGVWHSQCFPVPAVSQKEVIDLCVKLGFVDGKTTRERSGSSSFGRPVAPVLDKFYMVRINSRTWVVMRDDKPLVTLQPPKEICNRLYVSCT